MLTDRAVGQTAMLESGDARGSRGKPALSDYIYLAVLVMAAGYIMQAYGQFMDVYEKAILVCFVPTLVWMGWLWRPLRALTVVTSLVALLAIWLYSIDGNLINGDINRSESVFLLRYLLSSQSAILWMCVLFLIATVCYWLGYASKRVAWLGTAFLWAGVYAGTIGLLVRWREGHLLGPGIGHIPVSNLYEVFVMLAIMISLFYLYYERRYGTRALGGFVSLVISAVVVFLLWYALARNAQTIQPLLPALHSWWMKIHVPANFIGYGTFALASMVGFAYLVKENGETTSKAKLIPLYVLGVILCAEPMLFGSKGLSVTWMLFFGLSAIIVGTILAFRRQIAQQLPSLEVLDDIMYRAIAVGFAFFTIATILGALWAADAWGAYWQWDPKETWALIVWLNYAAWLHMRFMKGLRGSVAAYWALIGLVITSFAFLGVNMFLSGLHSYGEL